MTSTSHRHHFIAPLLGALALLALYGPSLARHVQQSADPMVMTEDARQHVAPYRDSLRSLSVADDYIGNYLRACHPAGYRALYTAASAVVDPRPFSKVLTYVLFAAFLALLAAGARRAGGWAAAVFAVALALSANIFLDRIAGGLVRSFAYPLAAAFFYGVLRGSARWMIGSSVASAAFYPTLAVMDGITLAALYLAMPSQLRGDASSWSLRRRLATLAGVALTMAALVLPTTYSARDFGPVLSKDAAAQYPEAGEGGRNGNYALADGVYYAEGVFTACARHAGDAFVAGRKKWLAVPRPVLSRSHASCIALAFIGLALAAARRNPAALRLAVAFGVVALSYKLAVALSPRLYLPERYLLFTVPVLALLGIPLGVDAVFARDGRARQIALLTATVLALAIQGGPIDSLRGTFRYPKEFYGHLEAVSRLPPDACIAAWPTSCDFIPYFAGRRVLIAHETHHAFHQAYVEEMRERMAALIAAFCATNIEPVAALRNRYGVTHMLVGRAELGLPPPAYFKPFDEWMATARGNIPEAELTLYRLLDQASVWNDGSTYLLDLSGIGQ